MKVRTAWFYLSAFRRASDAIDVLRLKAQEFLRSAMVLCLRTSFKECRRVTTRYNKLAANYLAFIQLASIRLWPR
jgi:transposase